MDDSDILARFAKSREFEATAGGWKFRLRLPTEFQERRFALDTDGNKESSASQQWIRDMVLAAVIGWEGPTLDDLLHDGDKTSLPWSQAITAALLESNLDAFDELSTAVHKEREARRTKLAAASKNSASVSNGS